jgi:transcriptional regulator with XRE-family HTH domain
MKKPLDNRASVTLALGLQSSRRAVGINKLDLANRIGCTPQHILRIEDRQTNPAQALIADLAGALAKTPSGLYQAGELRLDEKTMDAARRKRRRIEQERDLAAILEALRGLEPGDLQTIVEVAVQLSK